MVPRFQGKKITNKQKALENLIEWRLWMINYLYFFPTTSQIQTTLKSSIMSVSWLTAPEKNKLRNKIDELQLISKQDKFLDDQLLNLAYEDIEITENFLENIYNLKFYRRGHVFRAINKIADAGYIWSNIVSPISIDAVAIPNLKAIGE